VKLFTAEEIRRLLDAAGVQLKAMILLGVNCGFGNADCGNLPLSALDRAAASGETALDAAVLLLLCCQADRGRVANLLEQLHAIRT
jgi:hypothetical protein